MSLAQLYLRGGGSSGMRMSVAGMIERWQSQQQRLLQQHRHYSRTASSAFYPPAVSSHRCAPLTSVSDLTSSSLSHPSLIQPPRRLRHYFSTQTDAATPTAPVVKKSPYGKKSSPTATLAASPIETEFDLIILGGGSGGLALSKEASLLGQKVLLLDYVETTPHGSHWGLGGTCVNVGCIPKKLFHQTALLGEDIHEAQKFGWGIEPDANSTSTTLSSPPSPLTVKHHWSTLVNGVQLYIKSLNFGYRSRVMKDKNITYVNMRGTLTGPRTVVGLDAKGVTRTFTARKHIVVAVGGKPRYPSIPGAEYGITSDDIFSLDKPPGKTLVVGAGYIALESAGFLAGLGYDTTVMARSRYLRGFDISISIMIVNYMRNHGVKFQDGRIPSRIEKLPSGKLKVFSRVNYEKNANSSKDSNSATFSSPISSSAPEETSEEFDTVLFAIGRDARTKDLGLDQVGVRLERSSGKIICRDETGTGQLPTTEGDPDETNISGVFALGDVAKGRPELTPVAISAGKFLARRLYQSTHSPKSPWILDYAATPTTVFTPLEYASVGWSEDVAIKRRSPAQIEVYHSHFKPLPWSLSAEREENACYVKIIVSQPTGAELALIPPHELSAHQQVLGLHFLGPHAGEVMQGFAVAFRKGGLTRQDLEMTIGIHPTSAEEMLTTEITKSSGVDPQKTGC